MLRGPPTVVAYSRLWRGRCARRIEAKALPVRAAPRSPSAGSAGVRSGQAPDRQAAAEAGGRRQGGGRERAAAGARVELPREKIFRPIHVPSPSHYWVAEILPRIALLYKSPRTSENPDARLGTTGLPQMTTRHIDADFSFDIRWCMTDPSCGRESKERSPSLGRVLLSCMFVI